MSLHDPVNVLIVDDDRAIQRMLADALTKQGFVVTVERDGEWALRTFEKKNFDVVLLDLLLPAMSGYEVAEKLLATPKGRRVPIIFISGVYTSALQQQEAVEKHGAYAFLQKPVRLNTLQQTLIAALGARFPAPRTLPPPPPPDATDDDENTPPEPLADTSAREEASQVESASRSAGGASSQTLRGDFSEKPFPEVLAEIYRWKATGALLLRRAKVKKIIFFRNGVPHSVKSNLLSECLGRVMVREKMISEAECDESLKRMKASNRMQGTVLIEMGCISPHNLVHGLTLQLQTKIFDVFRWELGEYQLNPNVELPAETSNLEMTAAQIIYEGIKRTYDEELLGKIAGDLSHLYVHPSEDPLYALQDAGLGEDEQQLLQAADGRKTVATLKALALLPPLDTERFLYAMQCAQMVTLKKDAATGKPRISIAQMAAQAARPPPLPISNPSNPVPPRATPTEMELPPDVPTSQPASERGSRPGVVPKPLGSLLPELSGLHSNLSGDEQLVRERLVAKANELRKLNYFEILNVSPTASREDIKRAYFTMAKAYHPDKHFGSASAEIRQLATQLYDLISSAHDVLADPEERERYKKQLAAGEAKRDEGDEVGRILAAEGKFQRGEELLQQRDPKGALEHFKGAVALYGQEGEFHAYLGWTQFQLAPSDAHNVDDALRSLEKAISLNPKLDKSYLFTGFIYKATGRPDKAEKWFEKAIQCNPDCTEALRELRILGRVNR
ncbi:MAG: response regulator [Myxococcaceae bacterium]